MINWGLSVQVVAAGDPKCCVFTDRVRCGQRISWKVVLEGSLSIAGIPINIDYFCVCGDHADRVRTLFKSTKVEKVTPELSYVYVSNRST